MKRSNDYLNNNNASIKVPGRQEGAPPPAVVLVTELEVAHDDGDLRACYHQDDQHHEEKPEDEINLRDMFIDCWLLLWNELNSQKVDDAHKQGNPAPGGAT